jgi:uncharacterized membrane protein YbhN (UPF0104 family)
LPAPTRARAWLGPLAGLTLLVATVYYVDPSALRARISQLQAAPIVCGAALMFPQLYWLAARWRATAQQLGCALSQRRAMREYALSVLLNQLLPFGIAGDAIRALRHARGDASVRAGGPRDGASAAREPQKLGLSHALHAVVLDRLMGQLVVVVWALATLALWFGPLGFVLSALGLAALFLSANVLRRLPAADELSAHSAAKRALLRLSFALQRLLESPRYLASQFVLSSVLVLSIVAQLYCALWALGMSLSAAQALQVFPLMLLAMSIPLSFAGFGPREAATAQLYGLLQLSAADGAAFAMAYGALALCCSLPCLAIVLCLREPAA